MKKFASALISALMLLCCGEAQTDKVRDTYSSGRCPNSIETWRKSGELGHHEAVIFLVVDHKGELRSVLNLGGRKFPAREIGPAGASRFFEQVSSLRPEPLVILRPEPETPCAMVIHRKKMSSRLNCEAGRCGEGEVWKYLGVKKTAD